MTTDFSQLPPPPRPVTRVAARRSFAEATVRSWLVLAIVVAGVIGYLTYARLGSAWRDRALIEHGTPVIGRLTKIGLNQARNASRDERLSVEIAYTPPGGREMFVAGELAPKAGSTINLVDPFPIKIDPDHPERWTDLTVAPSLGQQLAAVFLLSPLLLLTLVVIFLKRARVLKVYRDGALVRALVVSVKQAPLAPASRLVRFSLPDETNVHGCYWPDRLGRPHPGDEIEILHLPRTAGRSLCAAAYV